MFAVKRVGIVLAGLLVILLILFWRSQDAPAPAGSQLLEKTPAVAPATARQAAEKPAETPAVGQTLVVLPDDGVAPVLDLIDGAQTSIRLKIYLLTYRDIRAALIRAANRGVDVRVIIEPNPTGGGDSNQVSFDELRDGGVSVKWAPSTYRMTHEKSLIVDDRLALVGTFNYTVSSFTSNREYGVRLDEPELVADIAAIFDADWEAAGVELSDDSPLVLSPVNSRSRILAMIDGARQTLWLEQSTLLDEDVVAHLQQALARGVAVRFIGPDRGDDDDYAQANYERLRQAGAETALLADPLVHAKVILADDKIALIGSINMTFASMDLNRELGLITSEPAVLERLRSVLAADWTGASAAPPAPEGTISWQEAENYVGVDVTVVGDIVRTYDSGKVTFLNFDDDYRNTLTIVLFPDSYELFPAPPADYFLDHQVEVSGRVKMYNGAPEIVVESPEQIRILDAETSVAPTPQPASAASAPPQIVAWQEAGDYIGQTITLAGTIVRTYDTGKVTFLNFSEAWQGTLSLVIFASDYDQFPSSPADYFEGATVEVTGRVKEYQGAPEIVVEKPEQIVITSQAPGPSSSVGETAAEPGAVGVIPWSEADNYLGQEITISGRIVRTHDTGSITFLDFSKDRDAFVAVVFADDYDSFPEPPASLYDGKQVWITGEVESYKGAPQIIIHSPNQVEVFE